MLLDHLANLIHFFGSIKSAGRVVRIADQDSFCVLIDQLFKFLYFRQSKAIIYRGTNRTHLCTGCDSKRFIVGVSRLRRYNFIAWVKTNHKCKLHSLRSTRSNDDIISRQVDVVSFVIVNQTLTIAQKALTWTVFERLTSDVL